MIQVKIPASEIAAIRRGLKKAEALSLKTAKSWIQGAGLVGESEASENAPFEFGTLRRSIRKRSEASGLHARVFTNIEYAAYQNDGTSTIKGKRFMEKGYTAAIKYLARKVKEA